LHQSVRADARSPQSYTRAELKDFAFPAGVIAATRADASEPSFVELSRAYLSCNPRLGLIVYGIVRRSCDAEKRVGDLSRRSIERTRESAARSLRNLDKSFHRARSSRAKEFRRARLTSRYRNKAGRYGSPSREAALDSSLVELIRRIALPARSGLRSPERRARETRAGRMQFQSAVCVLFAADRIFPEITAGPTSARATLVACTCPAMHFSWRRRGEKGRERWCPAAAGLSTADGWTLTGPAGLIGVGRVRAPRFRGRANIL